jgi:hypothetical protein
MFSRDATDPTGWQQYPFGAGIFTDVITHDRFPANSFVTYATTLEGVSGHWDTTGATSIYDIPGRPRSEGFRVFVKHPDGSALTPQIAKDGGWYIKWIGVCLYGRSCCSRG